MGCDSQALVVTRGLKLPNLYGFIQPHFSPCTTKLATYATAVGAATDGWYRGEIKEPKGTHHLK